MKRIKIPRFTEENGFKATEKTSSTLKKVKSKNSKVELAFRSALWKLGYRYRVKSNIKGKPDVIFPRHKVIVFIDGDFWHGFNWQERKKKLKTNQSYWVPKIERNMQRDKEVNKLLRESGWLVLRFWEHEILSEMEKCIEATVEVLTSTVHKQ